MTKDEWPKVLYLPRLIHNLVENHPDTFNKDELEVFRRLQSITYDGKFELYNEDDIKSYKKTFGNCDKWQVEKGDFKSCPFKATTLAVCSDYKTKKEALKSCKENNKRDSKGYKAMH